MRKNRDLGKIIRATANVLRSAFSLVQPLLLLQLVKKLNAGANFVLAREKRVWTGFSFIEIIRQKQFVFAPLLPCKALAKSTFHILPTLPHPQLYLLE